MKYMLDEAAFEHVGTKLVYFTNLVPLRVRLSGSVS